MKTKLEKKQSKMIKSRFFLSLKKKSLSLKSCMRKFNKENQRNELVISRSKVIKKKIVKKINQKNVIERNKIREAQNVKEICNKIRKKKKDVRKRKVIGTGKIVG